MSKIEFEQISDDEVEVIIPPETPLPMVQQLTKSFIERGLVEDLQKSTLSVRYFYRPADKANNLADKLIKSLSDMAKADNLPYWHPKAKLAHKKTLATQDVAERKAKLANAPAPNIKPVAAPVKPSPMPGVIDTTPGSLKTAHGTGKRYAFIKDEDGDEDEEDVEKSGYGPKKAGLYSPADNARRKSNNVGDIAGQGPNVNVKSFSTKPGQLSGKASADLTARIQNKANKKQPVRHLSPEEIAAQYPGQVKKSWGQHLPFPSAEEEIMKFAAGNTAQVGEDAMAGQLANMMNSKAMLNPNYRQPSSEEMLMAGEQMGFGTSPTMAKNEEQQWNGTINNWLSEAVKPISQRFASEEEELAYWSNIKVADRDDGKSGY